MGWNPKSIVDRLPPKCARRRERTAGRLVWKCMAATLHLHFREYWRDLKRGRPGRRFQDRYQCARRQGARRGAGRRIVLIVAALVCLAIGLVLTVIPGPAVPFFFLAGGLLATESRVVARFMDWSEVRFRELLAWAERRWRRLPMAGRVVVVMLVACGSVAGAYLTFRLFRG